MCAVERKGVRVIGANVYLINWVHVDSSQIAVKVHNNTIKCVLSSLKRTGNQAWKPSLETSSISHTPPSPITIALSVKLHVRWCGPVMSRNLYCTYKHLPKFFGKSRYSVYSTYPSLRVCFSDHSKPIPFTFCLVLLTVLHSASHLQV